MRVLLSIFILTCFSALTFGQKAEPLTDALVDGFYTRQPESLYWLSSRKQIKRATEWARGIELSDYPGMAGNESLGLSVRSSLLSVKSMNTALKIKTDKQVTAMILHFLKEQQEGRVHFEYSEIATKQRDSVYIGQLLSLKNSKIPVSRLIADLDCKDHDYVVLRKYMHDSLRTVDSYKYKAVLLSMNYRKYLAVNRPSECIVVNIPETMARYYRNDSLVMLMRTVVGRKKNPTPTIASNITRVVTFPHWNVPYSIAVKEILPKVQKNENYLEQHNFDVVDSGGRLIDDSDLNWNDYTEKNFPYFFRQSTGTENSLGVIKFDLEDPFSIFLHATSWQGAFAKDFRFLSHGCVRLEKPVDLANALLRGKLDLEELKKGKKDTESNIIALPSKIPTFLIYMPVTVEGEKVTFLKDVYGSVK
jgi:hypothetical protein